MNIATALLVPVAIWLLLLASHARRLLADWREPVFRLPVLTIESDDWGPGPDEDALRLQQLSSLLQRIKDAHGHPAVVTLGVVLAAPGAISGVAKDAPASYCPRRLDEEEFQPLLRAMRSGRDAGVFALQLHGMEHFWPPALLQAAQQGDAGVHTFLAADCGVPRHEALPSHLQARWIDASRLPSRALAAREIEAAVARECAAFTAIFGAPAAVAVPVTFTWTPVVESAWARNGVMVVVTPGTRNTGRDVHGRLTGDGSILRNGDRGAGGVVFVVRDIYFEPALGHRADRVLPRIAEHHRLGRPALLEMHRFNFTGDSAQAEASMGELRRLLQGVLVASPRLRFLSTETLAEALRSGDPALIERRLAARLRACVLRAAAHPRLRKLAWLSGLALVAAAVLALTSSVRWDRAGRA